MKGIVTVCTVLLVLPLMAFAGTLPDTGQTKCYDDVGNEINPCPNQREDFYGQDAQYGPNLQSFTKLDASGNDLPDEATEWAMVRDNVTGLIWEVKTDDGSIHDRDDTYNWDDAQDVFIAALNNDNFGGYSDWRLPTVKELMLVVDRDRYEPSINTTYFPNMGLYPDYWSSITLAIASSDYACTVDFFFGRVGNTYKPYGGNYVQAVRGEQQSTNNYVDNGDGTVTDTNTRLMWQKDTAKRYPSDTFPRSYTWQEALFYCENLTLAGYNDWHLPNVNELQSLVDYNRNDPSINTDYFPSPGQDNDYWSSTTYAGDMYGAWYVDFSFGYVDYKDKLPYGSYVRAVRSIQNGPLCPIELIYGEHSARTKRIRHFRDTILSKTSDGQKLIKLYYQWSPVLVKAMEADEEFKDEAKQIIDGVLLMIEKDSLVQ